MLRREFITLLGGAAAAWPFTARAQQGERMRRSACSCPQPRTMRNFGPGEGVPAGAGEIGLDHRPQRADRHPLGHGQADDIRRHAAELAALAPDVILVHGASTVAPLLQATRTVPIVFTAVADPVPPALSIAWRGRAATPPGS